MPPYIDAQERLLKDLRREGKLGDVVAVEDECTEVVLNRAKDKTADLPPDRFPSNPYCFIALSLTGTVSLSYLSTASLIIPNPLVRSPSPIPPLTKPYSEVRGSQIPTTPLEVESTRWSGFRKWEKKTIVSMQKYFSIYESHDTSLI